MNKNKVCALIVGAGKGKRMRSEIPKPYIKIKEMPIIALTLKHFEDAPDVNSIIVVIHPEWIEYCKSQIVEKLGFKKVIAVVKGGNKRQDSVKMGLDTLSSIRYPMSSIILIHDAVRPFITRDFMSHLIKMAEKYGAVVPGIPITDTIKEIKGGFVCRTLQRERLYEIQTPQVFKFDIIKRAYQEAYAARFYGTDDSTLVERLGIQVKVILGLGSNIKITTQDELLYAEKLLGL